MAVFNGRIHFLDEVTFVDEWAFLSSMMRELEIMFDREGVC